MGYWKKNQEDLIYLNKEGFWEMERIISRKLWNLRYKSHYAKFIICFKKYDEIAKVLLKLIPIKRVIGYWKGLCLAVDCDRLIMKRALIHCNKK